MLALMEMVKPLARKIVFISSQLPESIKRHISDLKIQHEIVPDYDLAVPDVQFGFEIKLDMKLTGDEIVVLDGYHFGLNYQQSIKQLGNKLVYIDDLGGDKFIADVVINHAPGASYVNNSLTQFYTGLEYAMLRKPFLSPFKMKVQDKKIAFVCMGGSDYFEYSLLFLELLNLNGGFDSINLVYSSKYPEDLIQKLNNYKSKTPLNLYFDLSAKELISLADESTHAFVSASTVLLECYARSLSCYAGYYTKNQCMIYNGFINSNLAIGLGDFSALDLSTFKRALSNLPVKLSEPLNSANRIVRIFNQL
jgi:spore coat polysaccharide biosynthesis predicted glycosyltransferase SpsG